MEARKMCYFQPVEKFSVSFGLNNQCNTVMFAMPQPKKHKFSKSIKQYVVPVVVFIKTRFM